MIKKIFFLAKKHSPEILTAMGIAGMISSTVLAVRSTPKALKVIVEKEKELQVEKLDTKELVKTVWKCYIPSLIIGGVSVVCLIGASSTRLRRNTALATAYQLSESTLQAYKDKVVEKIGEDKEKEIRDGISYEKLQASNVRNVILTSKGGNIKCYDPMCDRYFESDIDTIQKVVNDLNRRMRDEMSITLNEFYYELGLEATGAGELLGWNIDRGYIDIDFSSHLDAEGTPCLVMDYRILPSYDYL